jgi:hypothetical protein
MALATHGLLGGSRGTWGGIAQGTAGGAMLGMEFGGPIGAGIGAMAGFGIGLGEKLAGVESPENQAKRLIKQMYHIDINKSMAKQIAALSKSKFGDTMSIAVMSPEVRQMMGLYAAGTGQAGSMPQSAMTPHGASLVESGGRLMQQSMYQYGNPYTYQSNLPVYGGGATGSLPSPGGTVVLNINGNSAADLLEGRVAHTVTSGYVQAQQAAAMQSSQGRMDASMMFAEPGSIVS